MADDDWFVALGSSDFPTPIGFWCLGTSFNYGGVLTAYWGFPSHHRARTLRRVLPVSSASR
jgi:hypothetical protein